MWAREERAWEAEDGQGGMPGHSPRAQNTPTLLESENGTFRTSLWLSKSLSGPSQVSTIGDMSFRSEASGTLETTLPLPHWPFTTPHHHPGHHMSLVSLTIQRRQLAVGEVEPRGSETVPVTVHEQNSPRARRAPAPGFLW